MQKVIEILLILMLCAGTGAPPPAAAAPQHKPSPHYSIKKLKVLREGKFRAIVAGVLCNACTRSIVIQLKTLPGVKDAQFDFEEGYLYIEIAEKKELRTSKVLRALRIAGRKVNLGTRYSILEIRNIN